LNKPIRKRLEERDETADQLVVDVEVDVEEVPDEDHGPELQRPRNAGGALRLTGGRRRRRGRGAGPGDARREQGRGQRPQDPANAARGDWPAAAMRRRGEGGGGREGEGWGRGRAARRGPGSRGGGGGRRRAGRRHALHLGAPALLSSGLRSGSCAAGLRAAAATAHGGVDGHGLPARGFWKGPGAAEGSECGWDGWEPRRRCFSPRRGHLWRREGARERERESDGGRLPLAAPVVEVREGGRRGVDRGIGVEWRGRRRPDARRGEETRRNETEWSERAPDGGRRGAGGLGGCTARTGAECRLQTEAFFGQGPAATTECILDASVRPCLVPKNFTKFFRFSVTSNL